MHNYGIFHRFVGGIFHGCLISATMEYSTKESVEYSIDVQNVQLWNIKFITSVFRYSTNMQFVQPWNTPQWNIPQLRLMCICGIFHRHAICTTMEYSTVKYSMNVQIVCLWNIPSWNVPQMLYGTRFIMCNSSN